MPFEDLDASELDQRVGFHGVTWSQFEAFLKMRGDDPGLRIAYNKGELEIMAPSRHHEKRKKRLGSLLEVYLVERRIEFDGVGSWTMKKKSARKGIEPDECYVIGRPLDDSMDAADLAIEVIWSRGGGIDKLDIYRSLGVKEVWVWRRGKIVVHTLGPDGYEQRDRSTLLPELDLQLLARYVDYPSQSEATRAYREALGAH